jgi:hypothetical protein
MSECDREAWIMRRPWSTGGCYTTEKIKDIVDGGLFLKFVDIFVAGNETACPYMTGFLNPVQTRGMTLYTSDQFVVRHVLSYRSVEKCGHP